MVTELQRQYQKFDSIASMRTPADAISSSYSQLLQPYTNSMQQDKRVLAENLLDMSSLLEGHRAATAKTGEIRQTAASRRAAVERAKQLAKEMEQTETNVRQDEAMVEAADGKENVKEGQEGQSHGPMATMASMEQEEPEEETDEAMES